MTDAVLYRKYRPKVFDEVIGQPHVVKILKNALKLNRIAHAYLFSGPRGTGKTSVARILARAVNCANLAKISGGNFDAKLSIRRSLAAPSSVASGEGWGEGGPLAPCNSCQTCGDFMTGRTLDLVELDAASNRGIDEIRAICDAANFLPVSAKRKVYIIDEVHMLTPPAFNALLKTLEEPPSHVVFILATTEPEKVPDTISSRCQHLRFGRMTDEVLAGAILGIGEKEGFEVEPEATETLALFADGSLRDALNLLGQVSILAGILETRPFAGGPERKRAGFKPKIIAKDVREFFGAPAQSVMNELVSAISAKDHERAFKCLRLSLNNGSDPKVFIKILTHDFRNRFLNVLGGGIDDRNFSADRLEKILLTLLDTASTRFFSPHRELPLELAISRIIREV